MADERVTKSGVRILRHMLPDRPNDLKTSVYGDSLIVDGEVFYSRPHDWRYGFASTVIKLVETEPPCHYKPRRSGVLTGITG